MPRSSGQNSLARCAVKCFVMPVSVAVTPPDSQLWLYHITSSRNLVGIVSSGGLLSKHELALRELGIVSAAHDRIQQRRAKTPVAVEPKGLIHDYVPWGFAPHSPMLCAIAHRRLENQQVQQGEMVHLRTSLKRVKDLGIQWVFTDGHPLLLLSNFFASETELNHIDWPLMKAKFWNNTDEHPDRKRRREAEFLIRDFAPWELVDGIGVMTEETAQNVSGILASSAHRPNVKVLPDWYY